MVAKRRAIQKMQPLELLSLPDALLNMRTAAAVAGLSEATLYRKAASDPTFPKLIRMGKRCTRIRAGDLKEWLAKTADQPQPPATPAPLSADESTATTLRDTFAGLALVGLLANTEHMRERMKNGLPINSSLFPWVAESAYAFADDMLIARRIK